MKIYLLIFIQCFLSLISISAQDNWSSEGTLGASFEQRYKAVGFSIGSKGYVGTGTRGRFGFTGYHEFDDFWQYDPNSGVWTQKASLPSSRFGSVGFSIGNKGYIGIGLHHNTSTDFDNSLQDFLEYNPANNTWTNVGNILGGARYGAVAFTIGNKAYVGTGNNSQNVVTKDFFEFDPSRPNHWIQKKSFGGVARAFATGFAVCGKGYIGTGLVGATTGTDDFWEYDPGTDTWTSKNSFDGGPCYSSNGFTICTKGYIIIGVVSGSCDTKHLWEYDPLGDLWVQRASLPSDFREFPAVFSINGKGYLGTGALCPPPGNTTPFTYYNDFLSYTPMEANVPEQPLPINGNFTVCTGDIQSYSTIYSGCVTKYTWSIPSGATIIDTSALKDTITVHFGTNSGSISVIANNDCGMSMVQSHSLIVNPLPTVSVNGVSTICAGESTNLVASGASTYQWSPSTGLSNPNISNPIASPIITTIYSVIGTTNGCNDTSIFVVTVIPLPNVQIQGGGDLCEGSSLQLQASGANSYQWTPTEGLNNSNISNPIVSPTQTTTYSLMGTTNGCSSIATVQIIVHPTPATPAEINGDPIVCNGDELNLSILPEAGVHYVWTLPLGWGVESDTGSTIVVYPEGSGTVSVMGTLGNCSSGSQDLNITSYGKPSMPSSINGQNDICIGNSYSYLINEVNDATSYSWSWPSGWIVNVTSDTSILVIADSSGILYVRANNICDTSLSQQLFIAVHSEVPFTPGPITGVDSVCTGDTAHYTINIVQDASFYNWIRPSTNWTFVGDHSGNTATLIVGSPSGKLRVKAENGCGESGISELAIKEKCTVGTHDTQLEESTYVFPNPTNGNFTVTVDANEIEKIEVFDITGKLVYQSDHKSWNSASFNLSDIFGGLYLVRIYLDKGIVTKRLVKL